MKVRSLAVAATTVFTLTGCGSKTVVIEKVVEATTTTTIKAAASGEEEFFERVADKYPNIVNANGKQWVVEIGELMCGSIDEGMSFQDLIGMITRTGADAGMIGYMLGAAVTTMCPRNQWFIDSALQAGGA